MWHKNFAVLRLSSETSTLKCRRKYFFRSTAKLKCRKIKILDQKVKVKCREKDSSVKKAVLSDARKKQTWQPLITQTGRAMKKLLWNEEKNVWNREISHKAVYADLQKRKLSPSPGPFFAGTSSLSTLRDLFYIVFCSTLKQN